jgi:uncharacterized protein
MMRNTHTILNPEMRRAEFRGQCALAVMAKAPQAGQVKTRLSPPLDSHQAAALNIAFLRDTIECLKRVEAAVPAQVVLSYTPVGAEASFAGIVPEDVALIPQRGSGFGERLYYTVEDLFATGFSAVCVIDSDSPTVPVHAYVEAVQRLLSDDNCVVMGPCDDGGYYVLGLNALHNQLFENIAWSTEVVAEQTRQIAREIHLPLYSLPAWFDVDDRQTLTRLYRELVVSESTAGGFPAVHTRDYLRTIGDQLDPISAVSKGAAQ